MMQTSHIKSYPNSSHLLADATSRWFTRDIYTSLFRKAFFRKHKAKKERKKKKKRKSDSDHRNI